MAPDRKFNVQSVQKPGDMVNFRAVLLTRCQREFEQVFVAKRQELEKETDDAKKKEMKQELEYVESKAKRRSLGNIRFIGELFKLKMLTENIMHDCVYKLLRNKDPVSLDCVCSLLTTIGKELETDKAKPRMDQYFAEMGKIVNEKKMSSRVRFNLQDVIELRASKWVPRRADNNPKTIEHIHKEAAQEAQQQALNTQQALVNKRSQPRPPAGRRGPPIDPAKMKLSKVQQVGEQSIQLGPGGGAARFAGWGSNDGGSGRASQEKEKPAGPGNRSVLSNIAFVATVVFIIGGHSIVNSLRFHKRTDQQTTVTKIYDHIHPKTILIGFLMFRVIIVSIVWVLTFSKHHFWIFPNLTEDVGIIDAFRPLIKHDVFTAPLADKSDETSKKSDKDTEENDNESDLEEKAEKTETLKW